MCKVPFPPRQRSRAPHSRERARPSQILKHDATNSSVTAGFEVCTLGDEQRLPEKPRRGDGAESARAGGHQDIEEERKLFVRRLIAWYGSSERTARGSRSRTQRRDQPVQTAGREVCVGVKEQ